MEPLNTNHKETYKNRNCVDFIRFQEEIVSSFSATVYTPSELFSFSTEHFKELYHQDNLQFMLAFIHRCVIKWANSDYFKNNDIGDLLVRFLEDHENDERELNIAVQFIYQIINSSNLYGNGKIIISKKPFLKLISLLLSTKNLNLISNIIACIQSYKYMSPDIILNLWIDLLQKLKTNSSIGITNNAEINILIQMFDDFQTVNKEICNDSTLQVTIQNLLRSEQRTERKYAYYLLKKFMQSLLDNNNTNKCQQMEQAWTLYITLLENLEEEQSHLILPSLENLKELIKSEHIQSHWLHILFIRILSHNNNLVLRWSIEFFLKTFSCSDLNANILRYLLKATNSNLLYNYEGYFLNLNHFNAFLNGDLLNLYKSLAEIEYWKSVPLYIWLKQLNERTIPEKLSYELILNISACVRKLQNCSVREHCVHICNQLFYDFIKKMSTEEYVTYVETLYNSSDKYLEHKTLFNKKSVKIKKNIFTKRFVEIFTNSLSENINDDELFKFLNSLPIEQHGCLKFALFFLQPTEINKRNIMSLYNLDLNSLKSLDLCDIVAEFKQRLLDSPLYETICLQAAVLFYINQKDSLDNKDEDVLRIILDAGINRKVLQRLAKILEKTKIQFDDWVIEELIRICGKPQCQSLISYLATCEMDYSSTCKYMLEVIQKPQRPPFGLNIPYNLLDFAGERLFNCSVSKGETRIEQVFCFNEFGTKYNSIYLDWLQQVKSYCNKEYILFLLKYHKALSKRRPRYFENSYEHRIKLRISICILYAFLNKKVKFSEEIMDQIWRILLNENNQLNIIYIYEYILGRYETRNEIILKHLEMVHNLTSSQQVSIILVVYNFSLHGSLDSDIINKIISNMLALTMGANFQTRLFAQMALYKLLKETNFETAIGAKHIIESIEYATGEKLYGYLNDLRMHMTYFFAELEQTYDFIAAVNLILYITNAPFDEFLIALNVDDYNGLKTQILKCRETFMKKYKTIANDGAAIETIENTVNDQLQRKMNPVDDFTEPVSLISYPIKEKCTQIFVIASLIDKLPNLGGIARTCEVLGIQNLVVDSKMHTEKLDFKNLSMTAEKFLNILEVKSKDLKEFLLNKKLEGFNIVGAEQTSNSQNFNTFRFPKKCVLLLGHEKDGIPAPLLGLLDYAVEIPQFGQVRSLNVHVTGALFMWEYCKQHIIQK